MGIGMPEELSRAYQDRWSAPPEVSEFAPSSPGRVLRAVHSKLRTAFYLSRSVPASLRLFSRIGPNHRTIFFGSAPGDDVLCTTLFHEAALRGAGPMTMLTQHPEIFTGNAEVSRVIKVKRYEPSEYVLQLLSAFGRPVVLPHYAERNWEADVDSSPQEHVIAAMCRRAKLQGEVSLRPYLFLSHEELEAGRINPRQVVVQSSGLGGAWPMKNKEWFYDRFEAVVKAIRGDFHVLQVGSKTDPRLESAEDLRGKTTIRETAALMANSIVFVGLVGFLMHLARAVNCRSVIVYGGRERPWQSGYTCNVNLTGDTPCSPCWRWNTCDYDHECLKLVSASAVVEGVFAQAQKHGSELECDRTFI